MSRSQVATLSFIPVPGFPSLMQRDYTGFGLSVASTAAASALWIGASGHTAQRREEQVLVGVAGVYLATVAANHLFGELSRRKASIAVTPSERGSGAMVQLGLEL
jgi:hypothetical protein